MKTYFTNFEVLLAVHLPRAVHELVQDEDVGVLHLTHDGGLAEWMALVLAAAAASFDRGADLSPGHDSLHNYPRVSFPVGDLLEGWLGHTEVSGGLF